MFEGRFVVSPDAKQLKQFDGAVRLSHHAGLSTFGFQGNGGELPLGQIQSALLQGNAIERSQWLGGAIRFQLQPFQRHADAVGHQLKRVTAGQRQAQVKGNVCHFKRHRLTRASIGKKNPDLRHLQLAHRNIPRGLKRHSCGLWLQIRRGLFLCRRLGNAGPVQAPR